jgi:polyhydroxybutyrate depolymerase
MAGVVDHVFMHGEIKRTYKIHVPESRAENAPLLFVLHGMSMTSDWTYDRGFNELADQYGFVVVYPQSLEKTIYLTDFLGMPDATWGAVTAVVRWNAENEDDKYSGVNDVDFLSQLARHLQQEYRLNTEQTFVAGFSNGGYMSYTLMCQAGDTFRGAGIVAGLMDGIIVDSCAPGGPKPLIHLHGTADSMVPIQGRGTEAKGNLPTPSAHDTVKYFAKLNNATEEETVKVSENTTAYIYKPEGEGAEARFYRIDGFIHYWPGTPYVGETKGKQMQDNSGISATALIWKFLSQY